MWTNEYSAVTPLPPEAVWRALRGLHEGTVSYPGADHFDLHGPFAVGTDVSVTPEGQETFQSRIVDLVENRTYADQTSYGDVTLLFRHTLQPLGDGTRVTHRLDITGPSADQIGPELGPQISGDFDVTMAQLLRQAERLHNG
jgi:hypothetical protein